MKILSRCFAPARWCETTKEADRGFSPFYWLLLVSYPQAKVTLGSRPSHHSNSGIPFTHTNRNEPTMVSWFCFYTFFQPVNYTTFSPKGVTVPCKVDTIFKKINLVLLENIQVLSLPDLLDLLVRTTTQMHHNLMRQKEIDITVMRDTRKDVQLIQSAFFLKKKFVNSVSPIM